MKQTLGYSNCSHVFCSIFEKILLKHWKDKASVTKKKKDVYKKTREMWKSWKILWRIWHGLSRTGLLSNMHDPRVIFRLNEYFRIIVKKETVLLTWPKKRVHRNWRHSWMHFCISKLKQQLTHVCFINCSTGSGNGNAMFWKPGGY